MTLLAKRYAVALHLAAKAAGAADDVERDLAALHVALQDRAIAALWLSPEVSTAARERVAAKLAQGRAPLLGNLLAVLLRRRRQEVLPDLYPEYRALAMAERGEVEGTVESPRPLSAEDLQRLQDLAQRWSGRRCTLAVRIRPELLGGVRLIVGNVLYDGSLKSGLEQLEQKLLQASV